MKALVILIALMPSVAAAEFGPKGERWYKHPPRNTIRFPGRLTRKQLKHYENAAVEAGKVGLSFSLSQADYKMLWNKRCTYCASKVKGISIGRLNKKAGYTKENCVSCCRVCDKMRGDLTLTQWMDQMGMILLGRGGFIDRRVR